MTGTNWYAYGLLLALAGLGYWRSGRRGEGVTAAPKSAFTTDHASATMATIRVQAAGWIGVSPPLMKLFVDGEMVGILEDRTVHEFLVPPGRRELMVRRDWYRSKPITVTVAPGDRRDLVAGCRTRSVLGWYELASTAMLALLVGLVVFVPAVRRSVLLCALLGGASVVPYLVGFCATFRPGGFVYLASADEGRSESETTT